MSAEGPLKNRVDQAGTGTVNMTESAQDATRMPVETLRRFADRIREQLAIRPDDAALHMSLGQVLQSLDIQMHTALWKGQAGELIKQGPSESA